MLQRYMDKLHRVMAQSKLCVGFALKVRNQMQRIIACSVGDGTRTICSGEKELLTVLRHHCRLVVDVGANIGDWSAALLQETTSPEIKVYQYEPARFALKCLRERFLGDDRVVIRDAAAGERSGSMPFYERIDCPTLSALTSPSVPSNVETYSVDIVCLDEEADRLGWEQVDLLKIDAEGHDAGVIHGATGLLREKRVRFLQFEYNSSWVAAGYTLTNTRHFLERAGYELYLIQKAGLRKLNWDLYGEFFSYSNLFAIRKSDLSIVSECLA